MAPGPALRAIVGIGASAGGLEAFGQLLHSLPVDTGMAFVLVQHLDPRHDSILPELLSSRTPLPVVQVTDGMAVKPNQIYVMPPSTTMTIAGGTLHLSPLTSGERHLSIDTFFRSLAEDQKANSIGVVLSGAASDGTLGLSAIKGEGGITFAQDSTASFDSMPRSAVRTGVVDFVLPPDRIAAELANIAGHPYRVSRRSGEPEDAIADGAIMQRIISVLRGSKGIDFSQYKPTTIHRRTARRIVLTGSADAEQYLELLRRNPDEVDALLNDLLINVTEFFRDAEVFEALKDKTFPTLLKDRPDDKPVRIWIPGCSTGEEVYSVAICLTEYLESSGREIPMQIFGTDVSETAIERARAGIYSEAAVAPVAPERLRRFFSQVEAGYQISRAIREVCIFSVQNITKDAPLSRMDLISCRNLLIYLGANLKKRVLNIFLYSLQPAGCLLLGSSETPGPLTDAFIALDRTHKIYCRNLSVPQPVFDLPSRLAAFPPFSAASDPIGNEGQYDREAPAGATVQRYVDRMLLAQYAPTGLLVDKNFRIVEFRGEVGPYLRPASGEADLDLMKMVREELALHVRAAIEESRKQNSGVRLEEIQVRDSERVRSITVAVTPISLPGAEPHQLVLFEEERDGERGQTRERAEPAAPLSPEDARTRVGRLEEELTATRRYLQTIIEELRSANEEAQSTNEELQSTNEELQTAKEELQSTNEELTTLNAEMQSRNAELGQVNNDLLNLLSSMNVPIVMMDSGLRIRRFTPISERVLNLIGTDVGRPISDLKPRINVPDLEDVLRTVIDTLAPYEREVQDREGRWYSMRVRPYRTAENRIDGAVLQLLDIDQIKRSVEQIRQGRDYAEAIINTVREPLAVLGQDLRIETANRSFYEMFRLSPGEVSGRSMFEVGGGLWDFPRLRRLLDDIVSGTERYEDLEIEHEFGHIGLKTMLLNARRIERDGGDGTILLAFEDITERKKAAEARYRRLFEAAKDGILIIDPASGEITDVNPFVEHLFGYPRAELVGRKLWEAGPLKTVPESRQLIPRICEQSVVRFADMSLSAHDGKEVLVEAVANAYDEGERKLIQFNVRDITDRRRFERQLEHTQKLESLGLLAGGIAHDFNNLLTGILGNASLALADMEQDSPARPLLRRIVTAGERAADLTRQMLAYSGKGRFVTEQMDLNQLVAEISGLVRSSLPKMVEVVLDLKRDLPLVEGDSGQIQQLVMNLVINGGEAISAGRPGSVTVRTKTRRLTAEQLREYFEGDRLESGNYVVLDVVDTGSGMDEATRSRIFDPFFTTKFTGRGLGLAAALGIVRAHRGAIRVYSQPGKGTSFEVLLPASARAPVKRTKAASARPGGRGGTVLVVDDEETVRVLAKAVLERNGYRVILAENGAEAVRIFGEKHDRILTVILDRTMPVMGGSEALPLLEAIDPDVPIILSSGYDETETLEHVAEGKPAGFVQKPYSVDALLEVVRSVPAGRKKSGAS